MERPMNAEEITEWANTLALHAGEGEDVTQATLRAILEALSGIYVHLEELSNILQARDAVQAANERSL